MNSRAIAQALLRELPPGLRTPAFAVAPQMNSGFSTPARATFTLMGCKRRYSAAHQLSIKVGSLATLSFAARVSKSDLPPQDSSCLFFQGVKESRHPTFFDSLASAGIRETLSAKVVKAARSAILT